MGRYNKELVSKLEKVYNEMDAKHLGIAYNKKGLLYAYRLSSSNLKEIIEYFYTNAYIEKFIKDHEYNKKEIDEYHAELEKEMEL